ncbi:MAG: hypothetical protein UU34_C0001G0119 [Candidatus Curtissbacteria bacterium GW2011_GWA1_41_11]|uniref:Glycosyltransferase 2-like domain-containing protein n=1 Tax=Candidatus Curtissbacteria bacterium GW2011_GWA1_41_11 TaxID=1618409 RepID=A0A0G0XKE3_9BACT|nr:MAG: hypothetical protein UU34_C0001G0119 [Candidatus Curtissbacteria bacterium GW2011_GWA1_41_11]
MFVSIIIPAYNEDPTIKKCIESLQNQSYRALEVIIVDDGSTDKTLDVARKCRVKILKQKHAGPGTARNLGAQIAIGEILVFVDADMEFDKNFVKDLIKPILDGKTIGTFSKNELNLNKENIWSQCWNINRNLPVDRLIPENYPNRAPVFRAILKSQFEKVGGFDTSGEYTDDWSLSKKLQSKSTFAKGAIYYHSNPSTLSEVFKQARWIGKNEFISGSILRKIRSIFFYSFPLSLIIGTCKSVISKEPQFIIFKFVYDLGVWISVIKSFHKEPKYK